MAARILVIDGNVADVRARQVAALGYDSGTGYAQVLRRIDPDLNIDIVLAADAEPKFPRRPDLERLRRRHHDWIGAEYL